MLNRIRSHKRLQLLIGLLLGIAFGFLLQRSGATYYEVIIGQLLLTDHTVLRLMLSAVVVGMVGVHLMRSLGWVQLHPKPGSLGTSVVGGLIFGVAFAILGYCPGTAVAAAGQGSLDALLGGTLGMVVGAGLFAASYPRLKPILNKGDFGELTLPELFKVNAWVVVVPVAAAIVGLLWWLDGVGS